jgi:hypothetical protein
MRNYDSLDITYCTKDREAIEQTLPARAKLGGGTSGPGFEHTKSNSYDFYPTLTKEEIIDLAAKLIDLNVKSFAFQDTSSLGRDD